MVRWVKIQDQLYLAYKRLTPDSYKLKMKPWKRTFHAKRNQEKAVLATLLLGKVDFKPKAATGEI